MKFLVGHAYNWHSCSLCMILVIFELRRDSWRKCRMVLIDSPDISNVGCGRIHIHILLLEFVYGVRVDRPMARVKLTFNWGHSLPNPPPCTPMGKGIGMILSAPILTLALYVFKGLCSRSVTPEGPLVADWFVLISVWMWIHLEVFMSFSRWTSFPCHKLAIKQLPTWENLLLWISAPSGGPMVYSHNLPLFIRALGGNVSL